MYHNINPVLISLGSIKIKYYGLIYIIGFVMAYFFIRYLSDERNLGLSRDDVLDYLVYLGFGVIIGARLFYFIFYNFNVLADDPLEIIRIWHGGMSFHGGLIGAAVFGIAFAKRKKISIYKLADITVIPLAVALSLGRIGNFINGELVGRITNSWMCIDYSRNNYMPEKILGCRWPSQLFESLKNLAIFISLWAVRKKNLADGFLFWMFITMYGSLRFFIEFFRQPDEQLGFVLFNFFTMGQVLCSIMVVVGIIMMAYVSKGKNKNSKE